MAKSHYRDNFGRWQQKVTANITKKLMKEAEDMRINVEQVVADKLKETHKANVEASYCPRAIYDRKRLSRKTFSYEHTGILVDQAIDTKIEKKSRYESKVSIIVKPIPYPNDGHRKKVITATQVYEWLREGTKGGGTYWFVNKDGERPTAYNYPTPAHLFEMHTSIQMKGFIDNLNLKDYARKRKYKIKK